MIIDNYQWFTIHKVEEEALAIFKQKLSEGNNIDYYRANLGCPSGFADPVNRAWPSAQEMNAEVKPLAGPSSILLALMASGMNGQQFQFTECSK